MKPTGFPNDQFGLQKNLLRGRLALSTLNLFHQGLNGKGTHFEFFLANGCQLNAFHSREFDVVEPDQSNIFGNPQPSLCNGLVGPESHVIIGGKDSGRRLSHLEKSLSSPIAGLLQEIPLPKVIVSLLEVVGLKRFLSALQTLEGHRRFARPTDDTYLSMPESDKELTRQESSENIIHPYVIHFFFHQRGVGPSIHQDDGKRIFGQGNDIGVTQMGRSKNDPIHSFAP